MYSVLNQLAAIVLVFALMLTRLSAQAPACDANAGEIVSGSPAFCTIDSLRFLADGNNSLLVTQFILTDNSGIVSLITDSSGVFPPQAIGDYRVFIINFDPANPPSTPPQIGQNISLVQNPITDCFDISTAFNLEVVSDPGPKASCIQDTVHLFLDNDGGFDLSPLDLDMGSNDLSCGTLDSLTLTQQIFTCQDLGLRQVGLIAHHPVLGQDTCYSYLRVQDTIPPEAVCTEAITVFLDSNGNGLVSTNQANLNSSDNCEIASLAVLDGQVSCGDRGVGAFATLIITDQGGLADTCTTNLIVRDTLAPVITCASTFTLELGPSGTATIMPDDLYQLVSDPCGDVLTTLLSQNDFSCADLGITPIQLSVIDEQNNSTTCQVNVEVTDVTSPQALCDDDIIVYLNAAGAYNLSPEEVDLGSSDACASDLLLSLDQVDLDCSNLGLNTIQLRVSDPSGNTDSCSTAIEVRDTIAPIAICQSIGVILDDQGQATIVPADLDGGSQDVCTSVSFAASKTSFSCTDLGPQIIALEVSDLFGNTSVCQAEVTVRDTISPTAVCAPTTIYLDAFGSARITAGDVDGGSSDPCSLNALSINRAVFGCGDLGNNQVTLTAIDGSGNTDQCTAIISVQDTFSPVALCVGTQAIYVNTLGIATLQPDDVDAGSQDNCGVLANKLLSQYQWDCSDMGSAQPVILSVADPSGNVDQCMGLVEVLDTIAPTAVCEDATLYLDDRGLVNLDPSIIGIFSSDNCGNDVTLSVDRNRFTCSDLGAQPVTLTVEDEDGNQATCLSTVTIADTISPQAICKDAQLYLDGDGQAVLTPADIDNGAVDNCGIPADRSVSQSLFSCQDIGVYEVILSIEDEAGNLSTCASVVEVLDTIHPEANCLPFTLELGINGQGTLTPDLIDNQSTDNCGSGLQYAMSKTIFDCSDLGDNEVVLSVTDLSSLTSRCTTVITVVDIRKPIAVAKNIEVFLDASGQVQVDPMTLDDGSTDNCSIIAYELDKASFDCSDLGPNLVNLTLTDADSNQTTEAAVITVRDTISPVISCPDHLVFSSSQDGDSDCAYIISDDQLNPIIATDNCSIESLTHNLPDSPSDTSLLGGILPIGTNEIVWTMDDGEGQISTCSIQVTIQDTDAPVAICRDSVLIRLSNLGSLNLDFAKIDDGSYDNCAITSALPNKTEFDCNDIGFHNVVTTLRDAANNMSSCTTLVGVISSGACEMPVLRNSAGPDISDPCTCRGDGAFDEQVVIGPGNPGLQWTIKETSLLDPVTLQPYATGTLFQEIDQGNGQSIYVLQGVHLDGAGYTLTAESPFYTEDLSIQNICYYPQPEILGLEDPICLFTNPLVLEGTGGVGIDGEGTFFVNGQERQMFDPMEWGIGAHQIDYTFDAGDPSNEYEPLDVACPVTVSKVINVLETPESFACNDMITITANAGCEVLIFPEMILSGNYLCYDDYEVFISYDGRSVPNPVPAEFIGLRLRILIRHKPSGRLCFGNIELIDRFGPRIDSCASDIQDRFICSDVSQILNNQETIDPESPIYTGLPAVEDNCSGTEITFQDQLVDEGACTGDEVTAYIRRRFFAEDKFGNVSSCDQIIYFTRPADLFFPTDTLIRVDCNENPLPVTPGGNIAPEVSGEPYYINGFGELVPIQNNGGNCGFAAIYNDQRINICEGQYTLLREWRIFDFCTNTTVEVKTQLIEVGDFDAPEVSCKAVDLNQDGLPDPVPVYSTDFDDCSATIDIPTPDIFDCSSVTVETQVFSWVPQDIFGFPTGDTLFEALDDVIIQNGIASEVPVGTHYFVFRVRDICGNTTMDTCIFQVEDQVSPVVFCDDNITVTLNNEGKGFVFPGDIDEGSRDNCDDQDVSLAIRRLVSADCGDEGYTEWGNLIDLSCCDVGRLVTTELRVTDKSGNENNCVSRVRVEDKNRPLCLPPASVEVDCNSFDPTFDPSVPADLQARFGAPSVLDACGASWEEFAPVVDLDDCGFGRIIRQFNATDQAGNTSEGACQQIITVGAVHHYKVRFPADASADCSEPDVEGITFEELACDLLAVSVQNDTFLAAIDGCFKVHRTYQVINWCEYDGISDPVLLPRNADCDDTPGDEPLWLQVSPDGNVYLDRDEDFENSIPASGEKSANCDGLTNPEGFWISSVEFPLFRSGGFWRYTQHITVYDQAAPIIMADDSGLFCSDDKENCSGSVSIPFTVSETCTSPLDVTVRVEWDSDNDGILERELPSSQVIGQYPAYTITGDFSLGTHLFLITVSDGCGNDTEKSISIEVEDCQAPAPICLGQIVVELGALEGDTDVDGDGILDLAATTLRATDLVGSPAFDCSGPVFYSLNRKGEEADSLRAEEIFTCIDEGTIVLELQAWDRKGNHSYCEVEVEVQNNNEVCTFIPEGAIMGQVTNEEGMEVPNVLIRLSGSASKSTRTNNSGGYVFETLEEGGDYSLIPLLDESPGNGVTTYDLILIRRHILGYSALSSPYKLIAADVNNSGTITALDMVKLQRMILGYSAEFENNTSWRFVDASYTFPNPSNPWSSGFPEVVNINNLSGQLAGANFIAIKVGDVNLTSRVNNGFSDDPVRSHQRQFFITVPDKQLPFNQIQEIPFYLSEDVEAEGYQFTLQYHTEDIEIIDVVPGLSKSDQFGHFPALGMLTTSWYRQEDDISRFPMFLLQVKSKRRGEVYVRDVLNLNSRMTPAEAYDSDGLLMQPVLLFTEEKPTDGYAMLPVVPNPFRSAATVRLVSPKATQGKLAFYYSDGSLLRTTSIQLVEGLNTIPIDKADFPAGLIYCKFVHPDFQAIRKMIVLE